MLSRSAMVKLKAILVIDLLVVCAAAGAYFYFQSNGIIAIGATPASFKLTNLTIDPPQAFVGEAVQISVNLTNSGDTEGNLTVNLEINNVVADSSNITLSGRASQLVQFSEIETSDGLYNVKVGDLTGSFTILPAPPESSKIILSDLKVTTYEVWADESAIVVATAKNPTTAPDTIIVKVTVDGVLVQTESVQLDAGASQTIQFSVNATTEGLHNVKINTLSGTFSVVKTGYHTLLINRTGGGSTALPFTLNGESSINGVPLRTPYSGLLPVGVYNLAVPSPFNTGKSIVGFFSWSDGVNQNPRTFNLNSKTVLTVSYYLISGEAASCPSLFVWGGNGYSYVTDVANAGWLGYIGHINSAGTVVFSGGNPWDYVKLNPDNIAVKTAANGNSYYDINLLQQWDELFYLDAASLVVVDHPAGTDAYTTMTNYLNKGEVQQIYTVNSTNIHSPVAATDGNGQNVLPYILAADGVYLPSSNVNESPAWNNMTLNRLSIDLGTLPSDQPIKLVMKGIVDWGPSESYYNWIAQFQAAAAQGLITSDTAITPPPLLEIKAANGSWVAAPQDRQIPIPSDSNPRTFVVDLTGLFPSGTNDCQIRLTNSWNVTYDYIGIDTSPQQNVTIQKISPTATLSQYWDTNSTSSGNFTRYGDVTPLLQSADDMYVVGRQADEVDLQFSTANLTAPAPGMVRDYFFFVACWFKDKPGGWGYGFTFTVDPMPFLAMSGFPYTTAESYPYDAAHLAYIKEYNTRIFP